MPYGMYRTLVPVQRWTLPLSIPLLPLCAVRRVQNLSAYTTLHFTFTFTSTPPICRTVCTETQCLYNGALYLYLYLYSPCVSYCLYGTSVPVQRCTLTLPVLLIPYVPYRLYRASVPVQRCTSPLPIPLLPLWALRSVQNLSACTKVHFTFSPWSYFTTRCFRFPPQCKWYICSSGLLNIIDLWLVTGVSRQPMGPMFKHQVWLLKFWPKYCRLTSVHNYQSEPRKI